MLKKKSTTWGIRQMLSGTALEESPVQPAAETDGGETDNTGAQRQVLIWLGCGQ